MGIALPAGRGRSPVVELNLVPFIDLLSCLLAFLLMTAMWAEISAIEYDQRALWGCDFPPLKEIPNPLPPPPLTIHTTHDGIQFFRRPEEMDLVYKVEGRQDMMGLARLLAADYERYPEETFVVLNTDDDVPYGEMMAVWDLTRRYGLERTMMAGGPPVTNPMTRPR